MSKKLIKRLPKNILNIKIVKIVNYLSINNKKHRVMAFKNKDSDEMSAQMCHDLDLLKDFHQNDCTARDVRNLRNLAEKQRRDKLNGFINELANTVPLVTVASKRLDKTSVLRLSAAYLRLNKSIYICRDFDFAFNLFINQLFEYLLNDN